MSNNKTYIQFSDGEQILLAELSKVPVSYRNGGGAVKLAPQDIQTLTRTWKYVSWELFCRLAHFDTAEENEVIEAITNGEYAVNDSVYDLTDIDDIKLDIDGTEQADQLLDKLSRMEWPDAVMIELP